MENANKTVVAVKGVIVHEGRALIVKRSDHDEVVLELGNVLEGKLNSGKI